MYYIQFILFSFFLNAIFWVLSRVFLSCVFLHFGLHSFAIIGIFCCATRKNQNVQAESDVWVVLCLAVKKCRRLQLISLLLCIKRKKQQQQQMKKMIRLACFALGALTNKRTLVIKPHTHRVRETEKNRKDWQTHDFVHWSAIYRWNHWINVIPFFGKCDIFALESNEIENAKKLTGAHSRWEHLKKKPSHEWNKKKERTFAQRSSKNKKIHNL